MKSAVRFTGAILLTLGATVSARAQDLPPGVELATRYTTANRPLVSIRPLGGESGASEIAGILETDLRLSDRFELLRTPSELATGPVDYPKWNALRVVYVLDGALAPGGGQLELTVHDVVYGRVLRGGRFNLPERGAPDYRMAVHAVSDAIVEWITGQPGIAATQIAFTRQRGGGAYDLMLVDYDGENLRRILGSDQQVYSPTWSPDGRKLAFTMKRDDGTWALVERDMASGRTTTLHAGPMMQTPAYSPDGQSIVFAMWVDGRPYGTHLFRMAASAGSRPERLTSGGNDNLYPSYSPDGRRIVFQSNRTGRQHIYTMDPGGGGATLITPVGERVEYAAPDWSPTGSEVVFHGQSRSAFQVMLGSAARAGGTIRQLTTGSRNEDPSFAPDGRHIVYTGVGGEGDGLYVIDTVTGQRRRLTAGDRLRMAAWSPPLMRASLASGQ